MNTINIIGNLTREVELKFSQDGKAICNFSIAHNKFNKDTIFLNCSAFGKTAEAIAKFTTKGSKVAISGSLDIDKWEKDGVKHERVKIIVNQIDFLSASKSQSGVSINDLDDKGYPAIEIIEKAENIILSSPKDELPF